MLPPADLLDDVCKEAPALENRMVDNMRSALATMSTNTKDFRGAKKVLVAAVVDASIENDQLLSVVCDRIGVNWRTVRDAVKHRVSAMETEGPSLPWTVRWR